MGPVRPLSLIIEPSEVIVLYWAMLSGFFLYRLYFEWSSLYKGDFVRFSLNHGSRKRGHGGMVSGYPTSTSLPRVNGLSIDPRVLGRHTDLPPCWIFKPVTSTSCRSMEEISKLGLILITRSGFRHIG